MKKIPIKFEAEGEFENLILEEELRGVAKWQQKKKLLKNG